MGRWENSAAAEKTAMAFKPKYHHHKEGTKKRNQSKLPKSNQTWLGLATAKLALTAVVKPRWAAETPEPVSELQPGPGLDDTAEVGLSCRVGGVKL